MRKFQEIGGGNQPWRKDTMENTVKFHSNSLIQMVYIFYLNGFVDNPRANKNVTYLSNILHSIFFFFVKDFIQRNLEDKLVKEALHKVKFNTQIDLIFMLCFTYFCLSDQVFYYFTCHFL